VVKSDLYKGQECHRSIIFSRCLDFLRWFEGKINLLVSAAVLSEDSLENIQFCMEAVLVLDGSGSGSVCRVESAECMLARLWCTVAFR
jgi:hypothetical protein